MGVGSKIIPSYKCGSIVLRNFGSEYNNFLDILQMNLLNEKQAIEDKFSVSTTGGGNGQLTYQIGLMTVDEFYFAGGSEYENLILNLPYTPWYATYNRYVGSAEYFTMSPIYKYSNYVINKSYGYDEEVSYEHNVRPVISLDKCALYSSGDGTKSNPYTVSAGNCKEYNYPEFNYVDPEPQISTRPAE